jgi:plasmid stabilization system protein ParE
LELRVELSRYEAARAERAFHHCDPDNRLVARSLERRWEEKLRDLADAERLGISQRTIWPSLQADVQF